TQIFDSDYLAIFEEIASNTHVSPTFLASKLTEDIVSLERQGHDPTALKDDILIDIFTRLDAGSIAKESVVLIFEKLMKKEATTVEGAIESLGVSSVSDEELSTTLDKILQENMALIREKRLGSLGTLMGRSMAVLRGRADGQKISAMLKEKLEKLVG
ncbi:MAG: Glu-tRNA(Gln) amidotransferase subunit GatE, partial [Nitrososphaera sp.]